MTFGRRSFIADILDPAVINAKPLALLRRRVVPKAEHDTIMTQRREKTNEIGYEAGSQFAV